MTPSFPPRTGASGLAGAVHIGGGSDPYAEEVGTDIVVVNGGSSAGKTSIARCLQDLMPEVWLRWSIDDFVGALPATGPHREATIDFASDGAVEVGPGFRRAEAAWVAGIAAMARAGTGVIVDDVFLGGSVSQERLRAGFHGLQVLWVGVHCDPEVAVAREATRGDRIAGMAVSQADIVHEGVHYDVEVDTTDSSPLLSAQIVLEAIRRLD
jgi:chloramphenicol 3-O phosphotransferase